MNSKQFMEMRFIHVLLAFKKALKIEHSLSLVDTECLVDWRI